jgi:thiol:disulfide interchange protein DsbD
LGLVAGLGLLGATLHGQPPNPVHWSVQGPAKPVAAGAAFNVMLTAQIEPGWHLYALEEPEGGPMATQIGLSQNDVLRLLDVREPEPRMEPYPALRELTGIFERAAAFTLRVRAPGKAVPRGSVSYILVRYQSCNEQVCLPPHTETLTLPLDGVLP